MFVLANIIGGIAEILGGLIFVYTWVVIISALLSWVRPDPYNPIVRSLRAVTEPVYYQIRKRFPFVYASGMDFSPIVVLLVLQFADYAVVRSLKEFAFYLHA